MPEEAKLSWYKRKKFIIPMAALAVLVLFILTAMIVNYRFAHTFNLLVQADGSVIPEPLSEESEVKAPPAGWTKGLMTTDTMIVIGEDLFSNWLPNDKIYPTIFLDNPQNFQLGALEMMRYTSRAMRDYLVRFGSSGEIDPNCDAAFTLLSNDPMKWILPSAESRYKDALDNYKNLRARLVSGEAAFSPREDNLKDLLQQYMSLLGAINNRLANAPDNQRTRRALAGGSPPTPSGEQFGMTKVPWSQIDDNFYYAQGAAYVLRQMMVAIKYDFSDILTNKNATQQVDTIIAVLDQCQFEPLIVLNGDIGSITANHSMELHSLLENTRQRIRNLEEMLGKSNS